MLFGAAFSHNLVQNPDLKLKFEMNFEIVLELKFETVKQAELKLKHRVLTQVLTLSVISFSTILFCQTASAGRFKDFMHSWGGGRSTAYEQVHVEEDEGPNEYVLVKGNKAYTTPTSGADFLVMKYAASVSKDLLV